MWLFVGLFFPTLFFCCCCRFNSSVSSGSSCFWCRCPRSTLGVATYTNASHTHAHAHTDREFVRRRKEKIIQPPTIKATAPVSDGLRCSMVVDFQHKFRCFQHTLHTTLHTLLLSMAILAFDFSAAVGCDARRQFQFQSCCCWLTGWR